jgi:hypothetical protein
MDGGKAEACSGGLEDRRDAGEPEASRARNIAPLATDTVIAVDPLTDPDGGLSVEAGQADVGIGIAQSTRCASPRQRWKGSKERISCRIPMRIAATRSR